MSPKDMATMFPKGKEIIFLKDNTLKVGFVTDVTVGEDEVHYKVDFFGETGEVSGSEVVVSTSFIAINALQDMFHSK